MKETIIFRPDEAIKKLTVQQLCVFKEISKVLGIRAGRVDYGAISRATGLTWNGVSYVVDVLVRAQVLERENGQLKVLKQIVL